MVPSKMPVFALIEQGHQVRYGRLFTIRPAQPHVQGPKTQIPNSPTREARVRSTRGRGLGGELVSCETRREEQAGFLACSKRNRCAATSARSRVPKMQMLAIVANPPLPLPPRTASKSDSGLAGWMALTWARGARAFRVRVQRCLSLQLQRLTGSMGWSFVRGLELRGTLICPWACRAGACSQIHRSG